MAVKHTKEPECLMDYGCIHAPTCIVAPKYACPHEWFYTSNNEMLMPNLLQPAC